MISEIRKSIASAFYERTSSPLYGAFILSWIIWNWEIPYVSIFVDEQNLGVNKIEWVLENSSSINFLLWYPLISCVALILVMPFAANGAYWAGLKFRQWRVDQRNSIERKTLLTVEQSFLLREELLEAESKLERLLESKNDEIKRLSLQVHNLEESARQNNSDEPELKHEPIPVSPSGDSESEKINELVNRVIGSKDLQTTLDKAVKFAQGGYQGLVQEEGVSTSALAFLEANDVIEAESGGTFKITVFGKEFLKKYLSEKF